MSDQATLSPAGTPRQDLTTALDDAESRPLNARISAEARRRRARSSPREAAVALSPELALVDPELARWARAQLRKADATSLAAAPATPLAPLRLAAAAPPQPEPEPSAAAGIGEGAGPATKRRRGSWLKALSVVGLSVGLAVLGLSLRGEKTRPVAPRTHADGNAPATPTRRANPAAGDRRQPSGTGPRPVARERAGSATRHRIGRPLRHTPKRATAPQPPRRYRSVVRPARGPRSRRRYGNPVVRAKLVVPS